MYKTTLSFVPPSTNTYYRRSGHHMHISTKGREFKGKCIAKFKEEYLGSIEECSIKLSITLNFKDKRRRDIDNYQKALQDSMLGIIFKDDSQIIELNIKKNIGCGKDGTEIKIEFIK